MLTKYLASFELYVAVFETVTFINEHGENMTLKNELPLFSSYEF